MATRTCTKCGAPVLPDDIFCGECGDRLLTTPIPAPAPTAGWSGATSPIGEMPPRTMLQNRYQIIKRIGGGGMGNVYKAYDLNLDHALRAVKEMMEMFSDPTQRDKAVEDFRREAKLLASLKHPSIPVIYDHFIESGRYYLVMEFISGGDLATRQRIHGQRFPELTVTMWAIQVCNVLDYLHHRKPPIIYRDLKPANLMVDPEANQIMLIDFGIARKVAPREKGVTAIGTMGYAPPELFSGQVDHRSDIYSLGATIFHLLTGSDPRDKPLLIFDFSKNPKPCEINPSITSEMGAIITRAVEYEAANRFASAREMQRVLEDQMRWLETQYPEKVEQAHHLAFGEIVRQPAPQPVQPAPAPQPVQPAPAPSAIPSPPATPAAAAPAPIPETVFCSNCGVSIGVEDLYCAICGTQQPISLDSSQSKTAKLLVLAANSSEVYSAFGLDKQTNLIGRKDPNSGIFPEIDLTAYDPETKVSRRHARIWFQDAQYWIEDLSSSNGSVINDTIYLEPNQPHSLSDGDVLRLGGTRLVFKKQ